MKIKDNIPGLNFSWISVSKVIIILTLDLKEFKKCEDIAKALKEYGYVEPV